MIEILEEKEQRQKSEKERFETCGWTLGMVAIGTGA